MPYENYQPACLAHGFRCVEDRCSNGFVVDALLGQSFLGACSDERQAIRVEEAVIRPGVRLCCVYEAVFHDHAIGCFFQGLTNDQFRVRVHEETLRDAARVPQGFA